MAFQNSGGLSEPGRDLVGGVGLSFRESRDRLFCYGEGMPIDLLLVRDDDIPGLIAQGVCELGIVGRNVLEEQRAALPESESGSGLLERLALGFARCRLAIGVPQERSFTGPGEL